MAGTFQTQNKVRPGVYINISQSKPLSIELSDRGIVAIPVSASWGESEKFQKVDHTTDTELLFGEEMNQILPFREALKNANQVLAYRVNTGTNATGVLATSVTATALWGGTKGNQIHVTVSENQTDSSKFDVATFVNGNKKDEQTISSVSDFLPNGWIGLSGIGTLQEATVALTGGTDQDPEETDYTKFLEDLKTVEFHTTCYEGEESDIKNAFIQFARKMREEEGKKIQVVLDNAAADYEGVVSVKNGVILEDGTAISSKEAVAFVAGAMAGAKVNASNTYLTYLGAVDANPRYSNSETIEALRNGHIVFTAKGNRVVLEKDINTLVTYDDKKGKDFSKNRIIRVLDNIHNDIQTIFESNYIGKVDNNADGRQLLKSAITEYLTQLEKIGGIQYFDSATDIFVRQGIDVDSVVIEVYVMPVDSVEKIYMEVKVG